MNDDELTEFGRVPCNGTPPCKTVLRIYEGVMRLLGERDALLVQRANLRDVGGRILESWNESFDSCDQCGGEGEHEADSLCLELEEALRDAAPTTGAFVIESRTRRILSECLAAREAHFARALRYVDKGKKQHLIDSAFGASNDLMSMANLLVFVLDVEDKRSFSAFRDNPRDKQAPLTDDERKLAGLPLADEE